MHHLSEKNPPLSIRVPPTVRQALEAAARKERRSLSSMVCLVIEEWLATRAAAPGDIIEGRLARIGR
jgi:hypothetical protein